jgi:hypothetical protein
MTPSLSTLKTRAATVGLASAVMALLAAGPGHAGAFSAADVVRPLAGLSFDLGSKKAVGYFVAESAGCNLTLLVGDSARDASEGAKGTVPARFNTLIASGRTARIDSGEGLSVEFFCSTGAKWLTTRVMEQVAYSVPAK